MSHFNIIQITPSRIDNDDYISIDNVCEDNLFLSESDWGGEEINGENKKKAMSALKQALQPFAYVNVNKKTIRFRKQSVVKERWMKTVNKTVKEFRNKVKDGACGTAEILLRKDIANLGCSDLFYNEYCCKFSSVISDYLCGYLPQTIYIGAILDAHC